MTIGEKIKLLRRKRGLTQEALAGDFITRNMLSQIERGAALPSYQTLEYLIEKLDIDAGYFFSEEDDLFFFDRSRALEKIRDANRSLNFKKVISLAAPYEDDPGDEMAYIICRAYFELGKEDFYRGHLASSKASMQKCNDFASRTSYSSRYPSNAALYLEIIEKAYDNTKRIHLLPDTLENADEKSKNPDLYIGNDPDYLLYLIILNLIDDGLADKASAIYDAVKISSELYRLHINSKLAAAQFNYGRAKELLLEILNSKEAGSSRAPFFYFVSIDLENVCRALSDFEGAYYASGLQNKYLTNMSR